MKNKIFVFFAVLTRIFLGAVFVVSGFTKLIKPASSFFSVVESYQILKGRPAQAAANVMPWLEYVFGVFLILGLWVRQTTLLLWAMNLLFIAVLSSALIRKLPLESCGCFGESLAMKPGQMLGFDIALSFFFLFLVIFARRASTASLDKFFDK